MKMQTTIKRRKFKDVPRALNVQIEIETYRKLEIMSGRRSLGWMVERLIDREYDRRHEKLTLQLAQNELTTQKSMQ